MDACTSVLSLLMLLFWGLLLFLTSVAGTDARRTGLEGWDGGSIEWKNFALQRPGGGGGEGSRDSGTPYFNPPLLKKNSVIK